MTSIRADQLAPHHLGHLIRVPHDDGTRDLYLAGHRRCDCGRTTVYSPGHRQSYVLLPGQLVEVLAKVGGRE